MSWQTRGAGMNRALSPAPALDGELLRAFVAFAEELHFTRAAPRVGLSQPALFERIQRLGALLDAELYVRVGRGVALTDRGRALEAYARETLAAAHAFEARFRGLTTREVVTLAAGEGSYLHILPDVVRAFRDAGGALELLTLGGRDAMAAVESGRADLAVVVVDLVPRALESALLFESRLSFVLDARHPLAAKRRLTLRDVAAGALVLPPEGRPHRDFVARAIAKQGISPAKVVDADGWPLALAFAAMGLGVAIVNDVVVRGAHAAPTKGLVLRAAKELGTVPYRLVWRRGRALPPPVEELAQKIRAALRRRA
ncbi:MAG: LysR family transcriptional regulator [Polyangiaceae bacterium]